MSSFQSTAAVRACARRAASTTSAATLTSTTCRAAASRIQLQGQRSGGLVSKSWTRFSSSSIANDNQQKVRRLLYQTEWLVVLVVVMMSLTRCADARLPLADGRSRHVRYYRKGDFPSEAIVCCIND